MGMLRAAEQELSQRSEQLNLTTEMLRATEGELERKDEQLTLTMAMLRRAEGDLQVREAESLDLRRELNQAKHRLATGPRRQSFEGNGDKSYGDRSNGDSSYTPCTSSRKKSANKSNGGSSHDVGVAGDSGRGGSSAMCDVDSVSASDGGGHTSRAGTPAGTPVGTPRAGSSSEVSDGGHESVTIGLGNTPSMEWRPSAPLKHRK